MSFYKSIVYINDKAGEFGGTEEYLNSLSKILKPKKIRSTMIYGESKGKLSSDIDQYFHLPELAIRDSKVNIAPQISKIIDFLKPDIVYIHNIFNSSVFEALNVPERSYLTLFYLHDHYFTCLTELRMNSSQPYGLCERLLSDECVSQINEGNCLKRFAESSFSQSDVVKRWKLIKFLSSMDAILVVSHYMKELTIKHIPEIRERVWFIPRQVRSENLTNELRLDSEILKIAFIGRIIHGKGLHVALSALLLLNIGKPVEFEIAGVLENQDYWERCKKIIAKIHNESPNVKVTYKGELSYQEVDLLYNTLDILVFPSLWGEPLGTVAAEALCHECAVIASNAGGISVWLNENTGILVEPNQPKAIAFAIEKLVNDKKQMRKLALNGKRLILENFNEEQHLKVLNKILNAISQKK